MKKVFQKLGTAVLFVMFGLAALGSGESSGTENTKEIMQQTDDAGEEKEAEKTELTIEEQVLFEQDGVKVTAKGIDEDDFWGPAVNLLIENDSDKDVGVGCDALIVNGYMITDLFSSQVAAGKKANENMNMMASELEAAGIENIGKIEVYFHLFNPSSYETLYKADVVTIETNKVKEMDVDTTCEDDGFELYNQDGILIKGKYVDENSFWGTAVLLYIENSTDKNIGINCDNMSINGFMVQPYFSSTIYAGKKAIDDITIMATDLESNAITSVDDLEVNFHIYNADSYDTICDTGAISFSAKGKMDTDEKQSGEESSSEEGNTEE